MKSLLQLLESVSEVMNFINTGEEPETLPELPSVQDLGKEVVSATVIVLPFVSAPAAIAIGFYNICTKPNESITFSGILSLSGSMLQVLNGSLSLMTQVVTTSPAAIKSTINFCADSLPSLANSSFFAQSSRVGTMFSSAGRIAFEAAEEINTYDAILVI
jgi:hypothetical protein